MNLKYLASKPFVTVYDNTIQPYIPQLWAEESLAILEENMVIGMLIHRDFEPIVAQFGDTVNTRRPGQFVSNRKTPADPVTVQDATATNVQVPLNQHLHVSFLIKDGEESKSFKDLVAEYMAPAMLALARLIDQLLLGQASQFLVNGVGGLGQLAASNARATILNTREKMNVNKAYMQGRNLILSPNSETALLNLDLFTAAQQVGDDGTAIREASLGRKFGFDIYMAQNTMSTVGGTTMVLAGAVNHSGGYAAGYAGALVVNGFTGAVTTGNWLVIAGENTPYRIAAHTEGSGNTTGITLDRPLRYAASNSAVVTTFTAGAVNQAVSPTGYAAGYSKLIAIDNTTFAPQIGQMVTFVASGNLTDAVYTICQVNSLGSNAYTILLDRPLDLAIADDDPVNFAPPGDYNFAFHRNALALVVRPLATPRPGTGALSAVVNYNDLSMRATITYDGNKQGHLVTLDMLCGVAVLDTNLGVPMFG